MTSVRNKKPSEGCDYGTFNGHFYRICYGLTPEGKMDYTRKIYEFHKYCKCESCDYRSKEKREPHNQLTVSTYDKSKFTEVVEILNNFTCNSSRLEKRRFLRI